MTDSLYPILELLYMIMILPISFVIYALIGLEGVIFMGDVQGRFIFPIPENIWLHLAVGAILWGIFLYSFYRFFLQRFAKFIERNFKTIFAKT